jgi:DNA polymerase elongation subunit (family B)
MAPSVLRQWPLKGFQTWPNNWIRFSFDSLAARRTFMAAMDGRYDMAGDDRSNYFNKIGRECDLDTAGWNVIKNFRGLDSDYSGPSMIERTLNRASTVHDCSIRANVEDVVGLEIWKKMSVDNSSSCAEYPWLSRDYSVIMTFDIETYSKVLKDEDSAADLDTYTIFMIAGTAHYHWSTEALSAFCITSLPCVACPAVFAGTALAPSVDSNTELAPEGRQLVISAANEREVLRAFAAVLARLRPDITVGFNSGSFDWPRIFAKAAAYGLTQEYYMALDAAAAPGGYNIQESEMLRNMLKPEKIKIQAGEIKETNRANWAGTIDTDAMIVFKQLNPSAEVVKYSSLNYYLEKYGLAGKDDMPYTIMFRIFELMMTQGPSDPAADNTSLLWVSNILFEAGLDANLPKLPSAAEVAQLGRELGASNGIAVNDDPNADSIAILRRRTLSWGSLVARYCILDAFRCQQLYCKSKIVDDKREIAAMSHCTVLDAFIRANGAKVQSLVGHACFRAKIPCFDGVTCPIAFSNKRNEAAKQVTYPGALVLPPRRGLKKDIPVTALDAASLYPSIMMVYNMSPEKSISVCGDGRAGQVWYVPSGDDIIGGLPRMRAVTNMQEYAKYLISVGYTLEPINFMAMEGNKVSPGPKFNVDGYVVRHNGIIAGNNVAGTGNNVADFTVNIYDLLPDEAIKSGSVDTEALLRHIAGPTVACCRPGLANECLGIFPAVLKMLKDVRGQVKADMSLYQKIKDKIEKERSDAITRGLDWALVHVIGLYAVWAPEIRSKDSMLAELYDAGRAKSLYEECLFRYAKLDSKQKAIKVQMNTFYGEQGNYLSPINEICIAGGITGAGKRTILMIYGYLQSRGYTIMYGDTDSLYTSPDPALFGEVPGKWMALDAMFKNLLLE